MHDIEELKRQGLSVLAISEMTGYDRKTVRKYLLRPDGVPAYPERPAPPSKLDGFKSYLEEGCGPGCGMGGCFSGNFVSAATKAATRS